MKRKIVIEANGSNSSAKVTIELIAGPEYMRHEASNLAADLADLVMGALGQKYRASKINVVRR